MKSFIYLRQDTKKSIIPKITEKRVGDCCVLTMSPCSHIYDRILEKKIRKRKLPVFSEFAFRGISEYRPHKRLFYQELNAVLRKAGRRMDTDFCKEDIGIVCQTCQQAQALIPRLTAPVIWVFCTEEGTVSDSEEFSPVFVSRDIKNIRRLPAVIALTEHPALLELSPKTVLFNLTERNFVRENTVNDVWMKIPPELKKAGIPISVLNSILFDLNQNEKISSLQWG
ncbi:MAG: hypothetical protein E7399_01720 [Ruminococcaceae bacterium]|nr:hypothetical protein [Oscillospiraceae bacterium]